MNIVTTTSVFPPCYSQKQTIMRLKACGFRHLDLALDYCVQEDDFPFVTPAWREWAMDLAAFAKEQGVQYTHAHAEGDVTVHTDRMIRGFEVCRILGISYMVIHPVYRDENGQYVHNAEQFISMNAQAVRPLLAHAERTGVVILSENLLRGASIPPSVIAELVERVNSPWFGWCYDTGHANAFDITADVLIGLKHPPRSLHMQDNHGFCKDEHLLPGDGTIDWNRFLEVLHVIGYKGDLVLEAHHQSLEAPDEEREAILSDLYARAASMKRIFASL